ncbi:MAG TPA: hypothetical protein VH762_00805 [Gemmatimonadaceae bacterium]|jgi:hypothetical protein
MRTAVADLLDGWAIDREDQNSVSPKQQKIARISTRRLLPEERTTRARMEHPWVTVRLLRASARKRYTRVAVSPALIC